MMFILLGAVTLAVASACSKSTTGVRPVNVDAAGLAIRGHDAVAYFRESRPVEGDDRFTFAWNGATWRFASAENRDLFAAEPAKYAPQFGGYCSWAVSHGYTADADPAAWKVVEGRLYLNYNPDVLKKWETEQADLIQKGAANWERFKVEAPTPKK